MKTETNNPLLSHPFRFIPFSIILLVQGVSQHHIISFYTGVAETIFSPPTAIFSSTTVNVSSCDVYQASPAPWTTQFCYLHGEIMLYFLLGLTAEMIMMTVMDDTVKMNGDFIGNIGKNHLLALTCLSVRPYADKRIPTMISGKWFLNWSFLTELPPLSACPSGLWATTSLTCAQTYPCLQLGWRVWKKYQTISLQESKCSVDVDANVRLFVCLCTNNYSAKQF